jgi:uncharacterized protein
MNTVRCPICDTPMPGNWQEYPQYPFCTPRCKTIDLGRWLGEKYSVADPADPDKSSDDPDPR